MSFIITEVPERTTHKQWYDFYINYWRQTPIIIQRATYHWLMHVAFGDITLDQVKEAMKVQPKRVTFGSMFASSKPTAGAQDKWQR